MLQFHDQKKSKCRVGDVGAAVDTFLGVVLEDHRVGARLGEAGCHLERGRGRHAGKLAGPVAQSALSAAVRKAMLNRRRHLVARVSARAV